jgi:putative peptidoglycan lipid II flippase
VLVFYSAGVWAFCAYHVLTRTYYSANYMATPARMAGIAVVLNLALNLVLIWWLAEAGLAAATSVTFICQAGGLYLALPDHVRLCDHSLLVSTLWKSAVATVVMSGVVLLTLHLLPPSPAGDPIGLKVLRVSGPVLAGAAAYLGVAALLHARLLRIILQQLTSAE